MIYKIFLASILILALNQLSAQTEPIVRIDTSRVVFKPGLSFPYWLNAGQTLKKEVAIKTISVLEFNLDSSGNLKFVKPFSLTSNDEVTVPDGKVWKIEALGLREALEYGKEGVTSQTTKDFSTSAKPAIFSSPATFATPGSYKWTVPPDVNRICVEIWGAGGSGGDLFVTGHKVSNNYQNFYSGGGGGGTYAYQCFDVKPNTEIDIYVGNSDEVTYVGNLIKVDPGQKGTNGVFTNYDYVQGLQGEGGATNAYFKTLPAKANFIPQGESGANNGGLGGSPVYGNSIYMGDIYYVTYNLGGSGQNPGGGGGGCAAQIPPNLYANAISNRAGIQANGGIGGCGKINIFW